MAVYTAYSDEAGIGDPDGEFLVAGYLARESVWPEIVRAWRERVLDGPPRIPMLHMTDIRSWRWRDSHGISHNEAEHRVEEAVRVIYSTGDLDAVASVIRRSDLYEIFPKPKHKREKVVGFDKPDYVCYTAYIRIVLLRAHKLHPDATKVNFVFARKDEVIKDLRSIVDATRYSLNASESELAPLFGEFVPGEMEEIVPLQVADLICWHLQCYYRGGFERTDEDRMWYLLKERDGDLHKWSRERLAELAAQIAAFNPLPGRLLHDN
jgi:hypothetical protein